MSAPNGEPIIYRQVADPLRPVYFLRNPSSIYGVGSARFHAFNAYQTVTRIIEGVELGLSQKVFDL